MWFADRADAGRRLAEALRFLEGRDVVVLGLPRGGVPVAYEVARALHAPLDVIVVRKLGVPFQPELAMGAVGEGGVRVLNDDTVRLVRADQVAAVEERERAEVVRRAKLFRGDRRPLPLAGRTVVVVDDGIATGATARAACEVARAHDATHVVLAVPVGPPGGAERMYPAADEVICLYSPADFFAIGQYYTNFAQLTDAEVAALLRQAHGPVPAPVGTDPAPRDEEVSVQTGTVRLAGRLQLPADATGIVVFAHGSGSSRNSPRNRYVAAELNAAGLGTLLFDLLTVAEEADRGNVFDIGLLAHRLADVTAWLRAEPDLATLPIGYFGASPGAAAALVAAAEPGNDVAAVVSRGGRPDLAASVLDQVRAPTRLIVGGNGFVVIDLNRAAQRRLRCENRLEVVPGATHLFEEPGTLDQVSVLAAAWFLDHLAGARAGATAGTSA